jgi:hypothetical protein
MKMAQTYRCRWAEQWPARRARPTRLMTRICSTKVSQWSKFTKIKKKISACIDWSLEGSWNRIPPGLNVMIFGEKIVVAFEKQCQYQLLLS